MKKILKPSTPEREALLAQYTKAVRAIGEQTCVAVGSIELLKPMVHPTSYKALVRGLREYTKEARRICEANYGKNAPKATNARKIAARV